MHNSVALDKKDKLKYIYAFIHIFLFGNYLKKKLFNGFERQIYLFFSKFKQKGFVII